MPAPELPAEPGISLSTPYASYADGIQSGVANAQEWKSVRVVLAEMTPTAHALVISPLMDCGLVAYPPAALVRVLVGAQQLLIESCSTELRTIGLRVWNSGVSQDFSLRFDVGLEFWDFLRIISQVMCDAEACRADIMDRIPLVLDTMPSHGPSRGMLSLCSDEAHYSQTPIEENAPQALHPA